MRSTGAVVIGGYINGLGVVRALAARGVRTAVVTTKPYDIAHRSRWVSAHEPVSDIEDCPERLIDLLERRAADWAGWALFPTNDEALAALAQHETRLAPTYRLVIPSAEATGYILDKRLMNGIAAAVGADLPTFYGPAVDATAANPDLRFPVLVKPVVSYRFFTRFGSKLFLAHNHAELRLCMRRMAEEQIEGHVSELIPGSDDNIYSCCTYTDQRGEPCASLTVRKLRQSPPGFGVARVAEVVDDNAVLREITVEILRRIGFRGMAVAEFKKDPRDGRFRFIELNGRSIIYNRLLRKAGADMVGLAWSDYVDGQCERAQPHRWPGAWVNLHADLLYSALYSDHRVPIADFVKPYLGRTIEAVWSPVDPGPFLWQWSRSASMAARALSRGTHRELIVDRTRPQPTT